VLHRGPERLALRRQINGVNERMVALKQQLDVQHDANVALADEITATVNTARAAGVDPKNVRAVYDEIDRLKAEIEQIEKERVAGQPNPPLGVDM
jgi:septation ring formation regulator EzrA